jgi:hypothetical protein
VGACSVFSPKVPQSTRDQIESQVKPGMTLEVASGVIASAGYDCDLRKGSFIDEDGREHEADRFLLCTRRPGQISFRCNYRPQVIVAGDREERVLRLYYSHAGDCT